MTPRQFRFAVNTHGKDKDWDWEILASRYQDREGTLDDVIHHVKSGHALCAGLLGGQRRAKANVIGSEWLLLDIDNSASLKDESGKPVLGEDGKAIKVYSHQLTLDEAIADPFVQRYCSLIYTTASHQPDWHKFRLVFLLPRYVEGSEAVEAMVRLLMEQFPHDPACKDASRVFFGSTDATFPHINPDACLPADWLDQAISLAHEEKQRRQEQLIKQVAKREQLQQLAEDEGWDIDRLIQQALDRIPPRSPGSNNYSECLQVLMALVAHYGATEAEIIAERWSPSIRGTTWNISKKVRSFRRSGITIGTLFKIAQGYGFRFPERKKQEWKDPREPDQAAYNEFVSRKKEQWQAESGIEKQRKIDAFRDETERIQAWMHRLDLEPTLLVQERYLPPGELPAVPGIVLVDAPMSTGKTSSYVRGLVEQQAKLYPEGKFISLGPRNALQFQTVHLYGGKHHTEYANHEAMLSDRWWVCCYDSDWKLISNRVTPRSILFLDETSSGFEHILDGSTVKNQRIFALERFKELAQRVISTGGWIVASEDTLTNVEIDLLKDVVGNVPITLVKSEWKTNKPWQIDLYESPSMTWEECQRRLEAGENLILCSSSAAWLRETERFLIDAGLVNQSEVWILDGDSSHEPWAHQLVRNPDAWIDQNAPRVFGYSPSIESGVSITHPHFDAMAIHLVMLPPRSLRQMPARYRQPVPRFGYVQEFALSSDDSCKSLNPDALLHDLRRTTDGIAKLTQIAEFTAKKQAEQTGEPIDLSGTLARMLSGEDPEEAFWLKHWARIKARQNYGKANLRTELIRYWEEAGHQVNQLAGANKTLRDQRKEIRKTLDLEEAQRFAEADANNLTTEEARNILEYQSSTPDDRLKAHKRLRIEQLPGCNLDDVDFVLKTFVKDKGQWLKATELLWAVKNPEWQKALDRAEIFGKVQRQARRGEIVWRPDIRTKSLQAELIARSPLEDCLTEEAYTEDSVHVQKFREWALWNKAEIKRVLRLTVKDEHSGTKILNKFLRKLGYELNEFKRGPRGEQVRWYQISNFSDVDREAILEALTVRFKQKLQAKPEMYPTDTVSVTCTDNTPIQVADTAPMPSPNRMFRRQGSLSKWVIDSIDGQTAVVRQVSGWASKIQFRIPLDELEAIPYEPAAV